MGAVVLLGTLYPLVLDALGLGKISVGPPYFDTVFVPLMAPLVFLMGVGPAGALEAPTARPVARCAGRSASAVLAPPRRRVVAGDRRSAARSACCWRSGSSPRHRHRPAELRRAAAIRCGGARAALRAMIGMMLAHLGVAAFIVGVTMVKAYEVERDVKMAPGDTDRDRGYAFTFRGVREVEAQLHGRARSRSPRRPDVLARCGPKARLPRAAEPDDRGRHRQRPAARPLRLARRAGPGRRPGSCACTSSPSSTGSGGLPADRWPSAACSPPATGATAPPVKRRLRRQAPARGRTMMKSLLKFLIPLALFVVLAGFLGRGS